MWNEKDHIHEGPIETMKELNGNYSIKIAKPLGKLWGGNEEVHSDLQIDIIISLQQYFD